MNSLSVILSVIALGFSVVAVFYAYKRHIEERKPVLIFDEKIEKDEATKEKIIQEKAIPDEAVHAKIILEKTITKKIIKTMIINIGKGPALNIEPAPWSSADSELWELPKITRNLACTGEVQRQTVFSTTSRLIKPETHWEIHYEDIEGRKYRTVLKGTHHVFERLKKSNTHST